MRLFRAYWNGDFMNSIKLKKGKWVSIQGIIEVRTKGKGYSSWKVNNPLILLGKCNHVFKKVIWYKDIFGKRKYHEKGYSECKYCGIRLR